MILLIELILSSSGEKDIPGLTDTTVPRRLGPKRASKIRKLFNLAKEDDVRQYVVRRPLNKEGETYLSIPDENKIETLFFFLVPHAENCCVILLVNLDPHTQHKESEHFTVKHVVTCPLFDLMTSFIYSDLILHNDLILCFHQEFSKMYF